VNLPHIGFRDGIGRQLAVEGIVQIQFHCIYFRSLAADMSIRKFRLHLFCASVFPIDFKALLYLADEAYNKKMKIEDKMLDTKYAYETFSNRKSGNQNNFYH
jgi:hypothetical protein